MLEAPMKTRKFKKVDVCTVRCASTLALSDLHLGRVITHAQSPEVIAPLVEGFERVLLLGDIVDHWYTSESQARNYEKRIRRVCEKAGVKEVIYFRGNHDAGQADGEEFALLDGVLYLHGHVVYHKVKGDGEALERIKDFNVKKYGAIEHECRSRHKVWRVIDRMYGRIPMAMMVPFKWPWPVVRRIKALADEISPEGAVHSVVLGHSHRPGVKNFRGLTMFNLGGWFKNTRAFGFVRNDERARLVQIEMHSHRLRWGKVMHDSELQ